MGEDQMFTEAVNHRRLASQLKKSGYAFVPERERLIAEAQAVGDKLAAWATEQLDRSEEDFGQALEFYLSDTSGCA